MSTFVPPTTPPGKGRRQMRSPVNLKTPQTSSLKKVTDFFANANQGGKTPKSKTFGNSSMPITPDFTPQRSPRLHRKKKSNIEDIFRFDNSSTTADFLFLPTPSTVGSGRKSSVNPSKAHKASLTMDAIAKLNGGLNFESEIENDSAKENDYEDDDTNFFLRSPTKGRFINNSNLLTSPNNNFIDPPSPTKKFIPQTPLRQLIDDEKVNNWHGKSRNYFPDEEIDEEDLRPKQLVNPFLSNDNKSTTTAKTFKKPDVDYSTHVEFIHNKTGEKKVVKLLDRQAKIKPRKLDFSSAI